MQVKIYGYGWVGRSMRHLFPEAGIVDPKFSGMEDYKFGDPRQKADVGIVCVPTPYVEPGYLDCSIAEKVVREAPEDLILVRSTVMPGTCRRLEADTGKTIVFQPEYLGESTAHPLLNPMERTFMILGGNYVGREKIIELYQSVYNANIKIRQVSSYEAEIIKLSENRAIAFKIAQCQELYDVCKAAGVDYNTIREAVYGDDPRFNLWWTFVYPDKRGFNSKCIPKDVYAWADWAEEQGISPELTRWMLDINDRYLRAQGELQSVTSRGAPPSE